MERIGIAYIGNGKSTNRYHAPFVLALPERFRIVSVLDRHAGTERPPAWDPIPGVTYTADLDRVLSDPEVQVVEVCTPAAHHVPYARQALEAGKHVVVDKPFSATEAEAVGLFRLAESRGVTVQCYQNRRFDSDYLTARQVFEGGRLGTVFEVVTSYDYFRPHMMDGVGLDPVENAAYGHASHCLDQLIFWFGAPDRVRSELRQLSGPGGAIDYFDYDLFYEERGIRAIARANYRSALPRPSFELYGSAGAYIKREKDQQERDLKRFYLPAGHDDFGLDAPEQFGTLRFHDEEGVHEERVPSVRSCYTSFYEALYKTVAHGAPQLVRPEETITQMRILEQSVARLAR